MPVTYTQLASASASTTNTSTYTGTAGTPAIGNLLICFVLCTGNTDGNLSGTFTWTKLISFTKNSGADTFYVFWAYASSATLTTPVFTTVGGSGSGCFIHCIRISGADGQTQPYLRQIKTNTGTTTNPTLTFDNAPLTGNAILCYIGNGTSSTSQFTQPTGFNVIGNMSYGTPSTGAQTSIRTSGQTNPLLTWTNVNTTSWSVVGMEIYVAGSGLTEPDQMGYGTGFFGGGGI
jgi:hypothetical protein